MAMGKMRNTKCGTTVIGPHVRPRVRSYYAGAVVNCVMQM